MADRDELKILGFTKKEIEIIIMSLQVIRPNPCATNGCTARASDLVRIGAYGDAETARTQFAALRARIMTLPYLPKDPSQAQSTTAPNDADENNGEEDMNETSPFFTISKRAQPSKAGPAAGPAAVSEPVNCQPNPFLLTELEKKESCVRALGEACAAKHESTRSQAEQGEGAVDPDMPTEQEWQKMGDQNAW